MAWTQEILNVAAKLWGDGKSALEVAYLLNEEFDCRFTKNAVLGKLSRLMHKGELPRRADYKPLKKQTKSSTLSTNEPEFAKVAPAKPPPAKAKPAKPAPKAQSRGNVFAFKPISRPARDGLVTIDAVTGCLYAVSSTHDEIHLFCNKQKRVNSRYCQEHHDRCHVQAMVPVKKPLRVVR